MTSLVDVNVLLPVAFSEHPLRDRTVAWWEKAPVGSVVRGDGRDRRLKRAKRIAERPLRRKAPAAR